VVTARAAPLGTAGHGTGGTVVEEDVLGAAVVVDAELVADVPGAVVVDDVVDGADVGAFDPPARTATTASPASATARTVRPTTRARTPASVAAPDAHPVSGS
jgi:hypothetical protein